MCNWVSWIQKLEILPFGVINIYIEILVSELSFIKYLWQTFSSESYMYRVCICGWKGGIKLINFIIHSEYEYKIF